MNNKYEPHEGAHGKVFECDQRGNRARAAGNAKDVKHQVCLPVQLCVHVSGLERKFK